MPLCTLRYLQSMELGSSGNDINTLVLSHHLTPDYLLLFGTTNGSKEPVWRFPEKVYESQQTLRKCAESALKSMIGDLSHTHLIGNAPMGHKIVRPSNNGQVNSSLKRFFFKSQVIATNKFNIGTCEDYVWVTKDELLEYFPEQVEYLSKMIIS
ncbi:UNVERIFIED_CONTAM: hypothetical protein Sangu_2584500 [Sesamum angustifolium]|uniref:Large ribosomal subunit protein mL46 n=1 Tax=Sesamum angustifolium TaxID=2727405 RepID=A0AAW2J7D1_9LAMI